MSDYFRDLQNIATEQDRAKFAALVVEFGSTLQQLPKLRQEIDGFLTPNQSVDYAELVRSVRPKLEQAAAFLFEIDQLPTELRNAREVAELVKISKASLTLQTVIPLKSQLPPVCSTARQRLEREKTIALQIEKEAEQQRAKEAARRTERERTQRREEEARQAERRMQEEAQHRAKQESEHRAKMEAEAQAIEQKQKKAYFFMIMGLICGAFVGWIIPGSNDLSGKFLAAFVVGLFGSVNTGLVFTLFITPDSGQKRWMIRGMIAGAGLLIAIHLYRPIHIPIASGDDPLVVTMFLVWLGAIFSGSIASLLYVKLYGQKI